MKRTLSRVLSVLWWLAVGIVFAGYLSVLQGSLEKRPPEVSKELLRVHAIDQGLPNEGRPSERLLTKNHS
jgi:hypothetical protein